MKKYTIMMLALLATTHPAGAQHNLPSSTMPVAGVSSAASVDVVLQKIADFQERWAEIKYKSTDTEKQKIAMSRLEQEAAALVLQSPDRPEAKIWDAIILSTEAGFIKGILALPKVKKAKALLEASLRQDPHALEGSAYTSLGSLYYQVPGWPIGFGDKDKAEKNLKAALDINPDGIDPNFFYGDYLVNQKKYQEAIPVLEKALGAPDRPQRILADEGRRHEIRAALATARKKIQSAPLEKSYN